MGLFMSYEAVSMFLFTDCNSPEHFHKRRVSEILLHVLSFRHRIIIKLFVNLFLASLSFFEYMTHLSASLIWFVPLNHQKSDDRPLFKLGAF